MEEQGASYDIAARVSTAAAAAAPRRVLRAFARRRIRRPRDVRESRLDKARKLRMMWGARRAPKAARVEAATRSTTLPPQARPARPPRGSDENLHLFDLSRPARVPRESLPAAPQACATTCSRWRTTVAAHQRPLAQCLADVAASDVYVGIFAWRYGFVPAQGNPQKLSITELEYRHALKLKKPCLIFLLSEDTHWSPHFMDSQTGEGKARQEHQAPARRTLRSATSSPSSATPTSFASAVSAALFPVQFAETPLSAAPPATAAPPPTTAARRAARPAPRRRPRPRTKGRARRARDRLPQAVEAGRHACACASSTARRSSAASSSASCPSGRPTPTSVSSSATTPPPSPRLVRAAGQLGLRRHGRAQHPAPAQPTANFGWVTDRTRDTEIDYTIIHEFGHVLGLLHEHQNPHAKIPWNKEAIYKAFEGPPNNWSRETVNHTPLLQVGPEPLPPREALRPRVHHGLPAPLRLHRQGLRDGPEHVALARRQGVHPPPLPLRRRRRRRRDASAKPSKRKPSKRRAGSR